MDATTITNTINAVRGLINFGNLLTNFSARSMLIIFLHNNYYSDSNATTNCPKTGREEVFGLTPSPLSVQSTPRKAYIEA